MRLNLCAIGAPSTRGGCKHPGARTYTGHIALMCARAVPRLCCVIDRDCTIITNETLIIISPMYIYIYLFISCAYIIIYVYVCIFATLLYVLTHIDTYSSIYIYIYIYIYILDLNLAYKIIK